MFLRPTFFFFLTVHCPLPHPRLPLPPVPSRTFVYLQRGAEGAGRGATPQDESVQGDGGGGYRWCE